MVGNQLSAGTILAGNILFCAVQVCTSRTSHTSRNLCCYSSVVASGYGLGHRWFASGWRHLFCSPVTPGVLSPQPVISYGLQHYNRSPFVFVAAVQWQLFSSEARLSLGSFRLVSPFLLPVSPGSFKPAAGKFYFIFMVRAPMVCLGVLSIAVLSMIDVSSG